MPRRFLGGIIAILQAASTRARWSDLVCSAACHVPSELLLGVTEVWQAPWSLGAQKGCSPQASTPPTLQAPALPAPAASAPPAAVAPATPAPKAPAAPQPVTPVPVSPAPQAAAPAVQVSPEVAAMPAGKRQSEARRKTDQARLVGHVAKPRPRPYFTISTQF